MNPEDGGEGKEWIEIYNDEEESMDLSGWEVWEGISGSSGPKIITTIPDETILQTGEYFIVEFSNKLNNGGDFVILYNSEGNEIDKTETLKDSSWSSETWQLCDSWEFLEATKGENNKCVTNIEEEQPIEETKENLPKEITQESIEEYVEEAGDTALQNPDELKNRGITPEVISLTPKDIKSEDNTESLDKADYAKYGFIAFCILIGVLLILKNKRKQKYETI